MASKNVQRFREQKTMPLVNLAFARARPALFVIVFVFTGSEQQSPCFSLFSPFSSKPSLLAGDKGTVYQKHRFWDPGRLMQNLCGGAPAHFSHNFRLSGVANRANRFVRIIRNWNPYFYSANRPIRRITRISDSRESRHQDFRVGLPRMCVCTNVVQFFNNFGSCQRDQAVRAKLP